MFSFILSIFVQHPALGGGFGPGFKVEVGWDFVGDAYNGQNAPVPSSNPMDCAGHGSHVAGIIAADDSIVQGVSPQGKSHNTHLQIA